MKDITEELNPAAHDLDLRSTEDILLLINTEDQGVAGAVRQIIPALARAVDGAAARLRAGGRVFYIGAGTSGRLGVLDAAEIPPTFGTDPDLFQPVLAGGFDACHEAAEASEDDAELGEKDLCARACCAQDVAVGIAASGETLYTVSALTSARRAGALTIALCCNPDSALARAANIAIAPLVGPEVIAGSTRMKAGTAQKLVLNMFSTAVMVRLGRVYGPWMIHAQMRNTKLKARGLRILMEAAGMSEAECRAALTESGGDLRVALVMLASGATPEHARMSLETHGWNLRSTLHDLIGGSFR